MLTFLLFLGLRLDGTGCTCCMINSRPRMLISRCRSCSSSWCSLFAFSSCFFCISTSCSSLLRSSYEMKWNGTQLAQHALQNEREQHKACKKYIFKSLGTMVTLTIIKNIYIYEYIAIRYWSEAGDRGRGNGIRNWLKKKNIINILKQNEMKQNKSSSQNGNKFKFKFQTETIM